MNFEEMLNQAEIEGKKEAESFPEINRSYDLAHPEPADISESFDDLTGFGAYKMFPL